MSIEYRIVTCLTPEELRAIAERFHAEDPGKHSWYIISVDQPSQLRNEIFAEESGKDSVDYTAFLYVGLTKEDIELAEEAMEKLFFSLPEPKAAMHNDLILDNATFRPLRDVLAEHGKPD